MRNGPGRGRGRGRGSGRGRGRDRGGRGSREGKRQFERRSGTGRGREIKKGGDGARNWGSNKNEARSGEGAIVEGKIAEDKAMPVLETEMTESADVRGAEEEEYIKEEQEDNTLSYEEYLERRTKPENKFFAPKEERHHDSEFSNRKAMVNVQESFLVMGGPKSQRERGKNKSKETLSIEVGFRPASSAIERSYQRSDSRPGRGSGGRNRRGGRGTFDGRGRRGFRGGRGNGSGSNRDTGFNVHDVEAFPSL